MTSITMLDLRKNSNILLEKLKRKEKILLSFRGKPVATIHPIAQESDWESDSFLQFINSIPKSNGKKPKLSNEEIDSLVYGIK
jgi:antitoxin (DNA-binding transcriptional repressor) of toxin-antitoxin stability system